MVLEPDLKNCSAEVVNLEKSQVPVPDERRVCKREPVAKTKRGTRYDKTYRVTVNLDLRQYAALAEHAGRLRMKPAALARALLCSREQALLLPRELLQAWWHLEQPVAALSRLLRHMAEVQSQASDTEDWADAMKLHREAVAEARGHLQAVRQWLLERRRP